MREWHFGVPKVAETFPPLSRIFDAADAAMSRTGTLDVTDDRAGSVVHELDTDLGDTTTGTCIATLDQHVVLWPRFHLDDSVWRAQRWQYQDENLSPSSYQDHLLRAHCC